MYIYFIKTPVKKNKPAENNYQQTLNKKTLFHNIE